MYIRHCRENFILVVNRSFGNMKSAYCRCVNFYVIYQMNWKAISTLQKIVLHWWDQAKRFQDPFNLLPSLVSSKQGIVFRPLNSTNAHFHKLCPNTTYFSSLKALKALYKNWALWAPLKALLNTSVEVSAHQVRTWTFLKICFK